MRRREFIALMGASATWPFDALAQEPGRTYRIGWLHRSPRNAPYVSAFFDQLRQDGFIEGQNLLIDAGSFGLREDQFADHASELVKLKADLILCAGDAAIRAAQQATKTIPILGGAENMVAAGLVRSLANPGGNTTGFSALASDLDGKRLELLSELAPAAHEVAVLTDPNSISSPKHLAMLEQAARTRGVELLMLQAKRPDEIESLIEQAKNSGVAGLNVLSSALLYVNRQVVLTSVERLRLPAIYPWPEASEEGGLIAYGARILQMYRDILARQAVKLLRGANPSELPVEQPTKFELVINLKTADAIGVTVPATLVARADKVIE